MADRPMRRQSKGYEIDMCNGTLANKILLFAERRPWLLWAPTPR